MAVIKPGDFGDARVKALLARHLEGMHANSPPGHVFKLDWSGLQTPEISFYALWEDEDLLGFGALKKLETKAGEIQSASLVGIPVVPARTPPGLPTPLAPVTD